MEIIYFFIAISLSLFFLTRSEGSKKESESFFFREKLKQLRERKRTLLLERSKRFFKHLFDYSLTDEQVNAVINDSKNWFHIFYQAN